MVELTARTGCALLLLAASAWCGYLAAHKLLPRGPTSARWAGAAVAALWLLQISFRLLATPGLFRLPIAVSVWCVAAAAATLALDGRAAWVRLGEEARAARATWRDPDLATVRPILIVGGALVAARVLRGLVAPPLGYDSLLYHLFKPGQWVATGRFWREAGPDWWSFLDAYPVGAEILWAWALLPFHGDGAIALAGVLLWATCLLGAFAAARALGGSRKRASVAAAAIAFVPAVTSYVTASYSDTTLLVAFIMAALFVQRAATSHQRGDVLLAAAALGLAASVKHSGLPFLLVGFALLAVMVVRDGQPGTQRLWTMALALFAAGAVAVPDYLHLALTGRSPLYPLMGKNPLLAGLFSGAILPDAGRTFDPLAFVLEVWLGPRGLGLMFPAVLVLGLAAAGRLLRRRDTALATLFLLGTAWMPAILFSPGYLGLRSFWVYSISRFLTPFAAAMILTAAAAGGRLAEAALMTFLVTAALFAVPHGWGVVDLWGLGALLVLLLAAAAALTLGSTIGSRLRHRTAGTATGALIALALLPSWAALRADQRYRVYASAAAGAVFDVHPSRLPYWPLWRAVDDGVPHVIAAVAGWNGIGHNWARYPLLGTRLQNHVIYVPPTRDRQIVDYRDGARMTEAADFDSWAGRLRAARVDRVVNLGANPIEASWMAAHPALFEPLADSSDGTGRAYRLRPAEAPQTGGPSP